MTLQAIVTDASERQALVAIRDLGRAGIVTGAVDPTEGVPAFASRWCAWSATVPDFARDPDAFIDVLLDLCTLHRPRALIPCHDGAIEALRSRRDEVERTVAVALAPEPALGIAIDKTETLAAATRLGVRVPRGAIVAARDDAEAALEESGLPAVLKPVRSWVGARRLAPILINERGSALHAIEEFLDAGTPVAVQEFLPGAREAVSLVYARGQVLARFAQQAHRMYPPLGGSSVLRESIPLPPDAEAAAERLVTELDLEGYSEVEFRRDREGRAVLMEINPRLSASVEIAVRSGVPFPRLIYAWAAGERIEPSNGYRVGMRMRWLGGDLSWLESALRTRGHPDLPSPTRALGSFAADSLRPAGYDYWDARDPRPALVVTAEATRNAGRRAARRMRRRTGAASPA
ncbi:MAG: ATP-grasp domain-containing protein, partial [Solirubrobacterales bacterium]